MCVCVLHTDISVPASTDHQEPLPKRSDSHENGQLPSDPRPGGPPGDEGEASCPRDPLTQHRPPPHTRSHPNGAGPPRAPPSPRRLQHPSSE